jgi:hypothetical protein
MTKNPSPWQYCAAGFGGSTLSNQIEFGIAVASSEAEAIGIATLKFKGHQGFNPTTVKVVEIDLNQMLRHWLKAQEFDGPDLADFGGVSKSFSGYLNVNDRHMVYCVVKGDLDELLPKISKAVPEIVKSQSFVLHSRIEQVVALVLGAFPKIPQWKKGDRW